MYLEGSIKQYLEDLAAKKAAPGGGSAAALAASIGTSLMSMVANFTAGNSKYKNVESKIADILLRVDKYSELLQDLIDKDIESYGKLSSVLKDKHVDPAQLEDAYKEAMNPPFEICKICAECLPICIELADYGNRNLITDTAIAAILLEGAFFSAKFNVYVNMKNIKDMDYVESVHKVLFPLEKKMPELKEEILEKCEDVIG